MYSALVPRRGRHFRDDEVERGARLVRPHEEEGNGVEAEPVCWWWWKQLYSENETNGCQSWKWTVA